uniref:Uncharacterized protein n=1 Tax=Arundo donax TaxID=35708 RepID=A0A0A9AXZ9_ARUDO
MRGFRGACSCRGAALACHGIAPLVQSPSLAGPAWEIIGRSSAPPSLPRGPLFGRFRCRAHRPVLTWRRSLLLSLLLLPT